VGVDLLTRPPDQQAASPRGSQAVPPPGRPSNVSRRVRRNRFVWSLALLALVGYGISRIGGGHTGQTGHHGSPPPTSRPHRALGADRPDRLEDNWRGDGRPVTFAFAGDVNFPAGTTLGDRLADDPATALGPTVPELLGGVDLSMVNLESALTDGTCPASQSKQFVFYAPPTALTALHDAGVTLITEANNHGEDCGPAGLQMALAARSRTTYPILGIGQDESQAFAPYRAVIHGQHIAVIAATQVIDSDLQTAWTATASQPGLASAYDVTALVHAVEAARRTADTVVVYLHWGTQLDACPNPLQEPLARLLVRAGADIIIGTHAHVLLGGGYLGTAYVDYGLGNFAFYNNAPPENASGALVITATGRHIDAAAWRPAAIAGDLPQPLLGAAAATAIGQWQQDRACADVTAHPGPPLATPATEAAPPAPGLVSELSSDSD
jgi:hypothetical protein